MRVECLALVAALLLGTGVNARALAADGDAWLAPTTMNFPMSGGNLGNQRFSALTGINKSNIGKLGGAWMIHTADGNNPSFQSGVPIVVDGVMYIGVAGGDVLALDAATGATRWRWKSPFGNQNNRGIAFGQGKLFFGAAGSRLVALDAKTGTLAWQTKVFTGEGRGQVGGTPGQSTYVNGVVFCGVSGGEGGVRGQFGAYDAETGKELWKFYTIPAPGEPGSDTWEGDSWKRGGGPLWTGVAVDPDLGLVYVPVGNASPDQDGSQRAGNNLYTVTIVALEIKTGKVKWYFQEVHHDLWDYDDPLPPVLADITYKGQPRKILIHGGKTGLTYILDRVTGKPLVGIEERPVPQEPENKTSLTEPFPLGDSPVPNCPEPGSVAEGSRTSCIFAAFRPDNPVVTFPGTMGGLNWAPLAYDPHRNVFYAPGSLINSRFDRGFSRPQGEPRAGTLTEMDPATNRVVWQVRTKFPLATGSGLLATASGLLFNGQSDGNLVAYDAANGEVLWKFQTGAGADAPVSTYEVNGQQYVAILSTGNGFQLDAGGDALWVFRIGGTLPQAAAPPEPPTRQRLERRGGGRPAIDPDAAQQAAPRRNE